MGIPIAEPSNCITEPYFFLRYKIVLKVNKSTWEGWVVLPKVTKTYQTWLNPTTIQGDLANQYGLKRNTKASTTSPYKTHPQSYKNLSNMAKPYHNTRRPSPPVWSKKKYKILYTSPYKTPLVAIQPLFFLHTEDQSSRITLRGMPLKGGVQEAP